MFPRLKNYPTEGAITIANGQTYVINLGEKSTNFLRVAQANAPFRIRLEDVYEINASAGKKFDTAPHKFGKVEVINNSGGNLTFLLEIGTGEISSDEVVISNNVNTTDAQIPVLQVAIESALEEVEVEINDVMALMQNDKLQRKPLTTLAGATRASYNNATPTIVSAGANVNGVIIRWFHMGSTSAVNNSMSIGGIVFVQLRGDADGGDPQVWGQDIFVPPGLAITANLTAFGDLSICYEVLP